MDDAGRAFRFRAGVLPAAVWPEFGAEGRLRLGVGAQARVEEDG